MHAEESPRRRAAGPAQEEDLLHIDLYFGNELCLMLERAGFSDVAVEETAMAFRDG